MKIKKRIMAILFSICAVLMLFPVQAEAAGKIDPEQDVSLTLSCQEGETALSDVSFYIYLVATVDTYGELTTTADFAQFNVDIRGENDDAWKKLASTLEGYVLRDEIAPTDSGKTDENGQLVFPNSQDSLLQGIYLVLGERHTQGDYVYEPSAFLVMLPRIDMEANEWIYDVTVNPKFDSEKVEEKPDTVTRKVLKKWADDGHEAQRPQEIIVQLLCDGKVSDTVTLNAENSWRYTWEELDNDHKWTVVEKEIQDYTVEIEREGITFVITNTYEEDSPQADTPGNSGSGSSRLPQTGQLWWPVPMLIAIGLFLIILGLLRKRGTSDEA